MKKAEYFDRMKPRRCEICRRVCFNYKSYISHRVAKHGLNRHKRLSLKEYNECLKILETGDPTKYANQEVWCEDCKPEPMKFIAVSDLKNPKCIRCGKKLL